MSTSRKLLSRIYLYAGLHSLNCNIQDILTTEGSLRGT